MIRCIFIVTLLSGCSLAHYHRATDGTVDVYGAELGVQKALAGFVYSGDAQGVMHLKIESINEDQTKALEAVVSGAVQGAVKGVKP